MTINTTLTSSSKAGKEPSGAQHTPIPWKAEGPTQNSESYDCWYIRGPNGETVAETDGWSDRHNDGSDARLIARAVNCYQELLETLRTFVSIDDADKARAPLFASQGQAMSGYDKLAYFEAGIPAARDAIHKATGD